MKRFCVEAKEAGEKLQVFLKNRLGEGYSVRRVKSLIDRNHCRVNGRFERFGCSRLRGGDRVEFVPPAAQQKIKIVFEDDHLQVIDKPAGVVTEDLKGTPAHRLDRDTPGLLILAKGTEEELFTLFRERRVKKRYLAIVDGVPKDEEGTIRRSIAGKTAITRWRLARMGNRCSLLHCYPETGRTHQIRIHLAAIGHPILGDGEYNRRPKCKFPTTRHLLHAEQLIFPHPITGENLKLTSNPPKGFLDPLK